MDKANTVTISLAMYEAMKKELENQEKLLKELTANVDKISVAYSYEPISPYRISSTKFVYEGKVK